MDKTTEFFTKNERRLTKCLESAIIKFSREKNIPLSSTASSTASTSASSSSSSSKIKSAKSFLTVNDLIDNFDQDIKVNQRLKIRIGKNLKETVNKEKNIEIKKQQEGLFTVNAYKNSEKLQEIFKNILIELRIIKKDTSSFNFNKKQRKKERRRTRREKRRRTRRERRRTRREKREKREKRRRTRKERRERSTSSRYN